MRIGTKINWSEAHERLKACDTALRRALHPDEDSIQDVLEQRARRLANRRAEGQSTAQTVRLLLFRIGEERYAFPLTDVAGLGPLTRCVPVPGGPPELCGVINHQGDVRSVLDLGRLLGRDTGEADRSGYFIHIGPSGPGVRLRVDQIDEVVTAKLEDMCAPEAGSANRYATHVHREGFTVLRVDALIGGLSAGIRGQSEGTKS